MVWNFTKPESLIKPERMLADIPWEELYIGKKFILIEPFWEPNNKNKIVTIQKLVRRYDKIPSVDFGFPTTGL